MSGTCCGYGALEGRCGEPLGDTGLCERCERLRVTSLFHRRMVPPGQPDLEKAGLN